MPETYIILINPKDIKPSRSEEQLRQSEVNNGETGRLDRVINSIKENGFDPLNPIEVNYSSSGKIELTQGNRRLFGAIFTCLKLVPVKVTDYRTKI